MAKKKEAKKNTPSVKPVPPKTKPKEVQVEPAVEPVEQPRTTKRIVLTGAGSFGSTEGLHFKKGEARTLDAETADRLLAYGFFAEAEENVLHD